MAAAVGSSSSSYAVPVGHDAQRVRMHWSTWVFVAGMAAMALSLAAVALGIPAKLGYSASTGGQVDTYDGYDPMKLSASIDSNIKYLDRITGDGAGGNVSLLRTTRDNLAPVDTLAKKVAAMGADVKAIDAGLGGMLATTQALRSDMQGMLEVSRSSGATMGSLAGDVEAMSAAMSAMYAAAGKLTTAMASVEAGSKRIANSGTSTARESAAELNGLLPEEVPPARTDLPPAHPGAVQ